MGQAAMKAVGVLRRIEGRGACSSNSSPGDGGEYAVAAAKATDIRGKRHA